MKPPKRIAQRLKDERELQREAESKASAQALATMSPEEIEAEQRVIRFIEREDRRARKRGDIFCGLALSDLLDKLRAG